MKWTDSSRSFHENWTIMTHPTTIPAYALWRLNWIHAEKGLTLLLVPLQEPCVRVSSSHGSSFRERSNHERARCGANAQRLAR